MTKYQSREVLGSALPVLNVEITEEELAVKKFSNVDKKELFKDLNFKDSCQEASMKIQ